MLPTLDAFAYYGGNGLGGDQNPANISPGGACATQTDATHAQHHYPGGLWRSPG